MALPLPRLLLPSGLDAHPRSIRFAAQLIRRFDERTIGALTGPLDALESGVLSLAMRHFLAPDRLTPRERERHLLRDIEHALHRLPTSQANRLRDLLVTTEYGPWVHGPRRERLSALPESEQQRYFAEWAGTADGSRRATLESIRHLVLGAAWAEKGSEAAHRHGGAEP